MGDESVRRVIYGANGHGKVVADICQRMNLSIDGYIDSHKAVGTLIGDTGLKVVGGEDYLVEVDEVILAIGDNYRRLTIADRISHNYPHLKFPSLVHPSAALSSTTVIGEGSVICVGSLCGPESRIGRFAILNTGSSLDHESILGDGASLAPAATVAGNSIIGKGTAICIGAKISHRIKIGDFSVIGAGSVVLKDLPGKVVAYGIPAKVVRSREPEDPYL